MEAFCMSKQFLFAVLASLLIVGCSSTPTAYNPKDSFALNVVTAAGISDRLTDQEVPNDTISSITDSAGFGFAWAASGYQAPVKGFNNYQTAGMNFAAWLLTPEAPSAKNHLLAWVPMNDAEQKPSEYLANLLIAASEAAAKDLSFKSKQEIFRPETESAIYIVYFIDPQGRKCQDTKEVSSCWIAFSLARTPMKVNRSPDITGIQGVSWFHDPTAIYQSLYMFPKWEHDLNELEILTRVSAHLPQWVYFYISPGHLRLDKGQKIKIPMVVQQGKTHYFVKAKNEQ
jgi:hypothetical protein